MYGFVCGTRGVGILAKLIVTYTRGIRLRVKSRLLFLLMRIDSRAKLQIFNTLKYQI